MRQQSRVCWTDEGKWNKAKLDRMNRQLELDREEKGKRRDADWAGQGLRLTTVQFGEYKIRDHFSELQATLTI